MKSIKSFSFVVLAITLTFSSIEAQIEKSYVIDAGAYTFLEWNFNEVTNVKARFRARGGGGNDIEVYVLDEDGFENWQNGHKTPTYYNSGRVTVGRLDINLKEGKYFLVMNNRFSVVSNKVVNFTFY